MEQPFFPPPVDAPATSQAPRRNTAPLKKQKINITLDPDVITWFKQQAGGRGYQTLINASLREAMGRATLEEALRRVIREEMRPSGDTTFTHPSQATP